MLPCETVHKYLSILQTERENHVHGMAMALGGFPKPLMKLYGTNVLNGLLSVCKVSPVNVTWAPVRRDAVSSIISVLDKLQQTNCVTQEILDSVMGTLLICLEDYTTDRRGDVGAWVRESAMSAFKSLLTTWPKNEKGIMPKPSDIQEGVGKLLQLSVERIDRTRKIAGNALSDILHCSAPCVELIPEHSKLTSVLTQQFCKETNWGDPSKTFMTISDLLHVRIYLSRLIMGYVYSLGGVSASLSQCSIDAFFNHLDNVPSNDERIVFLNTLFDLFEISNSKERLSLSLLKTIESCITLTVIMDEILEADGALAQRMFSCLKKECAGCHDYHKLVSVSTSLSEMLRLNLSFTKGILNQLLLFLGYQVSVLLLCIYTILHINAHRI